MNQLNQLREQYEAEYKVEAEANHLEASGWIYNDKIGMWQHPITGRLHRHLDAIEIQREYLDDKPEGAVV
jgi:hypothetical protein